MAVVAIDWDNTLVDSTQKWLPGAQTAIKRLREDGHKVIIHSCNRKAWIDKCLNESGIVVDGIWDQAGKPVCDLYVDDKGYHFPYNGDWNEDLPIILSRVKDKDNRKW